MRILAETESVLDDSTRMQRVVFQAQTFPDERMLAALVNFFRRAQHGGRSSITFRNQGHGKTVVEFRGSEVGHDDQTI